MKLSNKLLLLFFISIPVSLFAYNWLLREQYLAGNITVVKYNKNYDSGYVKKDLPVVKHVVIDGALNSGDPHSQKGSASIDWKPAITIEHEKNEERTVLEIDKLFKDIARTKIKGDTLFISFYKKERTEKLNFYLPNSLIKIRLNSLVSLEGTHGNFNIGGPFTNQDSMQFFIRSGNLALNKINAKSVNITADSLGSINMRKGNTIGSLSYSLTKKSSLSIENMNENIRAFNPVKVDSLTVVSISGKAQDMNKYLQ